MISVLASVCASNIVSHCRQIKVENDDKPRWLCDKTLSDPVALAILDLILSVVFAILLWAFKPTTKTERDHMNILEIFAQLQALVSELQAKIEEQSASLEAEKQASYDEGFAAGAASVGSDKIYSQAELDAAIAQARLNSKLRMATSWCSLMA